MYSHLVTGVHGTLNDGRLNDGRLTLFWTGRDGIRYEGRFPQETLGAIETWLSQPRTPRERLIMVLDEHFPSAPELRDELRNDIMPIIEDLEAKTRGDA